MDRLAAKNDHYAGKTGKSDSNLGRSAEGFTRFHGLSLQHSTAKWGRIFFKADSKLCGFAQTQI
ncbi:MAG: hypothetical protein DME67_04535 [Verrucomicrobia bacterium]|nr:MAG: hypothetical protein DME67_04535 [Verrucomicrobiota bacterium]